MWLEFKEAVQSDGSGLNRTLQGEVCGFLFAAEGNTSHHSPANKHEKNVHLAAFNSFLESMLQINSITPYTTTSSFSNTSFSLAYLQNIYVH